MTDMTATEIAAAVAELTEAIKAKGHPKGYASIDYNICGYGKWIVRCDRGYGKWIVRCGRSVSEPYLGHTERHTSARAAIEEAKRIVDALPNNDPQARSAEALRAALSAARKEGVDVAEIVGAGE